MGWRIRAHMTENCSCNMFCPCWFAIQEYMVMDQGWCAGNLTFQIHEGESDGVDLSGRIVALLVDWPGPTLFDGDGTARLYIDDGSSDEQARELEAIFQGQKGGVMELVASLVSTWLPPRRTPIQASADGDLVTVTVGDVGELRSQALRDGDGHGFTLRGGGFVAGFGMEEAELAPSRGTRWSDPEMPRSFESTSGARGIVNLSG